MKRMTWQPMQDGSISTDNMTLAISDEEFSAITDDGMAVTNFFLPKHVRLCQLTESDEAVVPQEVARTMDGVLTAERERMQRLIDDYGYLFVSKEQMQRMDAALAWLDGATKEVGDGQSMA